MAYFENKNLPLVLLFIISVPFVFSFRAEPLPSPKKNKEISIAFYNVENLFDTINDPLIDDDEFLPGTEKDWNSARYNDKIEKLSEVIAQLGTEAPTIIGLCEIENAEVLNDLTKSKNLASFNYKVVHIDSPDERGIDVGLIYNPKKFVPSHSAALSIDLGGDERPTRDILYVKGKIKKGPEIHVFVNHWPSRYGGQEKSEPNRIAAATVLKAAIDSITSENPDAAIICMGDFNDYPYNRSIIEVLNADSASAKSTMVNLMSGLERQERGSYNYRGEWGFLDQIIVSRSLADNEPPTIVAGSTVAFSTPEMIYIDKKYGDEKPSRTYGGPEYFGGYSDHLPVYTVLSY